MFPQWVAAADPGGTGTFRAALIGTMFYNGESNYHALYTGGWTQLTQWARLTSPAEGTYFPLHNTNISPAAPVGGCNAN